MSDYPDRLVAAVRKEAESIPERRKIKAEIPAQNVENEQISSHTAKRA